ncbi:hypothetical protein CR513_40467, partial [Mucuna pruriens]
ALIDKKKGVKNETTKWLEFFKDYNFNLNHHPSKSNIVVDVLSKKPLYVYDCVWKHSGYRDLRDSNLVSKVTLKSMKLCMLNVTNDMMEKCRKC